VTGATGFIGGALCKRLQSEGARVLGLARDPDKGKALAATGVEVVEGDILDHARMSEVVAGMDVVFHLAAQLRAGSEDLYRLANFEATRHLAEACARAGVGRFIFTSSIMALGPIGDGVVDETHPLREYGDRYGNSKIAAERALRQAMDTTDLELVITRPGMVYGPRSPGWTVRIFNQVRAGRMPLINRGKGTSYPIYIDNMLDGLILCATHPAAVNQTFNFVDDPVTWAEYFGSFRAMLDHPVPARRAPRWLVNLGVTVLDPFVGRRNLRYAADMLGGYGVISNQKAKDLLGWEPKISLEEGMRRTEVWLREAGYL
jgi:nucleoside-diphosphate-sugar epimerase